MQTPTQEIVDEIMAQHERRKYPPIGCPEMVEALNEYFMSYKKCPFIQELEARSWFEIRKNKQ